MALVKPKKKGEKDAENPRSHAVHSVSINPLHMSYLKVMIMNTGGGTDSGDKPTERRKQAIHDVVIKANATLVMFQEFNWIGIHGAAWKGFDWPDNLQYIGNKDASILFNTNELLLKDVPQSTLDGTLRELQRKGDIRLGFTPIPRMCLRIIKSKGVPMVEFICVSWHGRHNKAKLETLKEEFNSLLKYILKLAEKYSLPVLIAGDFNVKIKDIEDYVPSTLLLHKYKSSDRRDVENIIDFFISSKSLKLYDITALALKSETAVKGVLSLLDHDPVVASLATATQTKIEHQVLYKR